jgi:hypothetical protein
MIQPRPKMIHVATVTFRCLSSIESPARDAGAFSRTLKLRSRNQITKSTKAPTMQTTTGKLTFIDRPSPTPRMLTPLRRSLRDPFWRSW